MPPHKRNRVPPSSASVVANKMRKTATGSVPCPTDAASAGAVSSPPDSDDVLDVSQEDPATITDDATMKPTAASPDQDMSRTMEDGKSGGTKLSLAAPDDNNPLHVQEDADSAATVEKQTGPTTDDAATADAVAAASSSNDAPDVGAGQDNPVTLANARFAVGE